MTREGKNIELASEFDLLVRDRTPARLGMGRAGTAYTTRVQLQLRSEQAVARDAVSSELDLLRDLGQAFVESWKLFEVCTRARTKSEYLLRPHLGRDLIEHARHEIAEHCPAGADLQIAIGDGLSALAVAAQLPELLPLIVTESQARGWSIGRTFVVRHCRVGVMNIIGEVLRPRVVLLLIGERPGMSTAENLSAYMAYEPRAGDTDAKRNLLSNIHARGIPAAAAATRIVALAAELMRVRRSGAAVKEPSPPQALPSNSR